jgi:hypothetical protein
MTGPAIRLKAKQMAEWMTEVRVGTFVAYLEWIEKYTYRKMTKAQQTALTTGVRHAFLMQSTFESLMEMYYAGMKPSEAAKKMFIDTSAAVRKTRGLASLYKRASMMSAASYAASPESEAYWAS